MSEAYDSYLLKKRAYDRAAHVLDEALRRLRSSPLPPIGDSGCHIPLPGMSVRPFSPSRKALEDSDAAKCREIAELMKRALLAQKEAIRAWDLLSEPERARLKRPVADASADASMK